MWIRLGLFAIFALDRFAKSWVLKWHFGEKDHLFPKFELRIFGEKVRASIAFVTNSGAAWGLLSNRPLLLNFLRCGLILAIAIHIWRHPNLPAGLRFCWLAIVVSALSNIIDVLTYGHIIDLFSVSLGEWDFPVFNVADAVITFCWALVFLRQLSSGSQKRRSLSLHLH